MTRIQPSVAKWSQTDTFSFCGRQNQTIRDKMAGSGNNSRGWLYSHGLHEYEYTNTTQLQAERGTLRCLSGGEGTRMEQRKYPRFPINCTVTFTSDTAKGEGRVLNLSLGGGAIESEVVVTRGDYLKVQIKLPDQATLLEIDLAPVRWVDGKAFGVEFISMQPAAKDMLNQCVAELDKLLQPQASQS